VFDEILAVAALISGLVLLILCSDKATEHSVSIASALGMSPLMIGLVIVSLYTDVPDKRGWLR